MVKLARLALLCYGAVLVANGVMFVASPGMLTRMVEIVLPTPIAMMEIRGTYGGLWIGVGGLFVVAAARASVLRPGLIAMLVTMGGLVLGRAAGLIADGSASPFLYTLLAFEIVGTAVAWLGLRSLDEPQVAVGAA